MPRSTSVNHCIPSHEDLTTGNHDRKTSVRQSAIFPVNGKDDTGIANSIWWVHWLLLVICSKFSSLFEIIWRFDKVKLQWKLIQLQQVGI